MATADYSEAIALLCENMGKEVITQEELTKIFILVVAASERPALGGKAVEYAKALKEGGCDKVEDGGTGCVLEIEPDHVDLHADPMGGVKRLCGCDGGRIAVPFAHRGEAIRDEDDVPVPAGVIGVAVGVR